MARIKLGLVGVGKIARDQHLPVIAVSTDFELVAAASRNHAVDGVPTYPSLQALLDAEPSIEAVTLCAPPGPREADARLALSRGVHVLLEKPPATTADGARELASCARNVALYASWHSQHAAGVAPAKDWLRDRRIESVEVIWREDIRRWHPGQDWILEAHGMGVFDPGINALSILTHVLPTDIRFEDAELTVPSNRRAPIAARLHARAGDSGEISAEFDFRETAAERWDIAIATDREPLLLLDGGARLVIGHDEVPTPSSGRHHEYVGVYSRFASLVRARRSEVDLRPFELVQAALLQGRRIEAPPFRF